MIAIWFHFSHRNHCFLMLSLFPDVPISHDCHCHIIAMANSYDLPMDSMDFWWTPWVSPATAWSHTAEQEPHRSCINLPSRVTEKRREERAKVNIWLIYMVIIWSMMVNKNLVGGAITILKNMTSSMGRMTSHMWNGRENMFQTTNTNIMEWCHVCVCHETS